MFLGVLRDILKKFNTFCFASPLKWVYYNSMTAVGQKDTKPATTQVRNHHCFFLLVFFSLLRVNSVLLIISCEHFVVLQVKAVESPEGLPLLLPHYVVPGSAFSCPHSYHSLGHCLRTNIFPGLYIKVYFSKSLFLHRQFPKILQHYTYQMKLFTFYVLYLLQDIVYVKKNPQNQAEQEQMCL